MYALVDANSFYCSAEQVFRPQWRGRPLIVLSNNDGMIVAANRQAKALGVPKFQPFFKIQQQCQQLGIIACSSNYELYADLSNKMMQVIGQFAPEQHIYSIDECFLRFHQCRGAITDLSQHAQKLRRTVWKTCRLPVCVGIAPTLTLAKAANHAAKKQSQYRGVCVLEQPQDYRQVLSQMAVEDVWGIGRRLSAKLKLLNITTALALADYAPALAKRQFSVEVERCIRELNGQPCIAWQSNRADKQQIFSTRSMGQRITDKTSLQQALSKHASIAAYKARQQHSACQLLMCFASNSAYDAHPVSFKRLLRFAQPCNDTQVIIGATRQLSHQLYQDGVQYYKIGVGLLDLTSTAQQQLDWLNEPQGNPALMQTLDSINQKYGADTLFVAAQGIEQKWAMRRQLLTPQYTTRWRDLPHIKC